MSIAWCQPVDCLPISLRWIKPRYDFFLPVEVLSRVFRGKFHEALKPALENGQLSFHGDLKLLAQPKTFAAWLRPPFRKDWVVYAKRPFGGPQHVLHYLGRYAHRLAISNHRLVSFADGKVTFRWHDSAHSNEQKLLTLSLDEFLRRFLLHLLPEGFVRIRNFGFLANRKRATTLPLSFQLLGGAPQAEPEASTAGASDLWSCPKCGGPMMVLVTCRPLQHSLGTARHRSFPTLNLPRARVHRKSRAASFKSLYRKRANTPYSCSRIALRASDTTLRLIGTNSHLVERPKGQS
jgi:Putative transposase